VWATKNLLKTQWYDYKVTQAIDFWYRGIIEGYDLEFVVELHKYLTKAPELFNKLPHKRLIEKIPM
jgi:hypothetical protein